METAVGIPQNFLLHELIQIGTDNEWKSAFIYDMKILALKKNGTIWSADIPFTYGLKTQDSEITLKQLGNDKKWEYIDTYYQGISVGIKNDGTAWYWGEKSDKYFGNDKVLNHAINKAEF